MVGTLQQSSNFTADPYEILRGSSAISAVRSPWMDAEYRANHDLYEIASEDLPDPPNNDLGVGRLI